MHTVHKHVLVAILRAREACLIEYLVDVALITSSLIVTSAIVAISTIDRGRDYAAFVQEACEPIVIRVIFVNCI